MPAPLSSSPTSTVTGATTQSFLDILEQAGLTPATSGGNLGLVSPGPASQATANQNVDQTLEAQTQATAGKSNPQLKPFDRKSSKTNPSLGRGNVLSEAPAAGRDAVASLTLGLQMPMPPATQPRSPQKFSTNDISGNTDGIPIHRTFDTLASTVCFGGTSLPVSGISASETESSSADAKSSGTPLTGSNSTATPVIDSRVIDSKTSAAEVGVDEVNPTTPIPSSQPTKAPSAVVQSTRTDVNAVQSTPSQHLVGEVARNLASQVVTIANPTSGITSGTDLNDKRTLVISSSNSTMKVATADSQPLISFKDISPTKVQGDQSLEGLAKLIPSDAVQATIVANLIPGETTAPASDAKMKTGESAPVAEAARVADKENIQNAVAARSEGTQSSAQSTLAPSAIVFPLSVPETPTADKMPLAPVKPTSDRVSLLPVRSAETPGTSGKSVESTATPTSQSRKDGSFSSLNPQASDPTTVAGPTKIIDPSSSFSVVGGQSLTGDGKNGNAGFSLRESDPLPTSHADQESGGAAPHSVQPELQAAYPTSLINSAKLVERMGESELRLAMRTGEFGSVDIRTSMVRNQFTAEISVERCDLGRVMAADLPNLQNRLTEQAVPVANITLQNHSGGQSASYEHQKPRDGQQATNPVNRRDDSLAPRLSAFKATAHAPSSRLDIHM